MCLLVEQDLPVCRFSVCPCEIISRPLIGQKYECYIIIEIIEVDKLSLLLVKNINLTSSLLTLRSLRWMSLMKATYLL